ncbi:MAG: EAL domain-containing protein, partial [Gammaproteobacteria bacterium]|nr:EAL domain-containing protein [Gammaproteobacteria bacterium]
DILRHADMALHRAKNMGRGNIKFYEENLQKIVDERLQIEKGLRRAIELDELSLNFQPQTTIDGHMIGAEVLLRWNHPELGQVSPDRYIPVAEETGLIHAIGKWVLNEACLCLRTWQDNQIRFSGHLSVNVSAWQFANPEFVSLVTGILSVYNIKPHQVVLELTETALLYDIQETIDKLAQLQKHGIRIAIDDFGTGYSSLAYLKDMAMDILKIDKAFISELSRENEHPLVESIIAMGQHMNLEVIAEGVETEEQWNILRELGCETFQGYHVSHPLKETDFIKFLNKNNSMQ